jgi:ABC-type glycerol-3-phosphate transport system substrate-binding protein
MKRTFTAALLLGVLLILAACGGAKESTQPQKDIIGTWKSDDGTTTLTYTSDGMVHACRVRLFGFALCAALM